MQEIQHSTLRQALEDGLQIQLDELDKQERYEVCIAVWPDGTWCYREDISEYYHKSDDYQFVRPSIVDEDELEQIVQDIICEEYHS